MNINATLLGQAISFAIFVVFCMKYVWPPIIAAIENRQKEIADGLASAERATKSFDLAQEKAADQLREAKAAAATIIDDANKRKSQLIDEAKEQAEVEKARILQQGLAEVEQEKARVREELRSKVATLAIAGATKIIQRSVDEDANKDILDRIVAEL